MLKNVFLKVTVSKAVHFFLREATPFSSKGHAGDNLYTCLPATLIIVGPMYVIIFPLALVLAAELLFSLDKDGW